MPQSRRKNVAMALDDQSPLRSIGNYDLLDKIGEGGMGTVYKGRSRANGQVVAIKVVPPNIAANTVLMQRFEKEARTASKLDHPNVVRALEYGLEGDSPYLVMEFVEGESLGQRLERSGKFSEADAVGLIVQAAQALHHAHQKGLVHRDVKPDNLLVTKEGQVKLADLGLVKEMETDINLTRTGRGLGTPHFMAPEQFRNAKNADVRCDVYSLGATLYMMVTNELPFKALGPLDAWMKKAKNDIMPIRKIVPELSDRLEAAIMRAMDADPKKRPGDCQEFIADLTTGPPPKRDTKSKEVPVIPPAEELWYLVFKDEQGIPHTSKGTPAGIKKNFKKGTLGDANHIRVSRTKTGNFELLRNVPEFQDLFGATATPVPLDTNPNAPESAYTVLPAVGAKATPPGMTADSQAVDDQDDDRKPHFALTQEAGDSSSYEWLKVFLVALVAMAIGMGLFLLLRGRD